MKNIGMLLKATIIAVLMSLWLSHSIAAIHLRTPQDELLIDNFEGSTLNTTLWSFNTNSSGSSYNVSSGSLNISSGTTVGGGAWVLSKKTFNSNVSPLTLEVRTKVSVADGGGWGFLGNNGQSGAIFWYDSDLMAQVYNISGGVQQVAIPGIDITAWHTYRIEIEGSTARFFVDEVLKVTHTSNVPSGEAMYVRLDRISWGQNRTLSVDYVHLTDEVVTPPDFEFQDLQYSPPSPEMMEFTEVNSVLYNQGPDYHANTGYVFLDLQVLDSETGDEWYWRFPGQIDPVIAANTSYTVTLDRFWFTRPEIDSVTACMYYEDPEYNTTNNCIIKSITVKPCSWAGECLGVPIDALMFFIDDLTAGKLDAAQEAGVLYIQHAPQIYLACNGSGGIDCTEKVIEFMVDGGIAIATKVIESLSPHETLITLIKDGISLLLSSINCGDKLTDFLRASIEESQHRGVAVNGIVARSPIYIRAVDSSGRRAGFLNDGTIVTEIPDAEVAQIGEAKVVLYSGEDTAEIEIKGTDKGIFDLIVSISMTGPEAHTIVYDDVPVFTTTVGMIDVFSGQYTLALDDNNDGTTDRNIQPDEEVRTHFYSVYLPLGLNNQ